MNDTEIGQYIGYPTMQIVDAMQKSILRVVVFYLL